ncbi:MAG: hypothetical protein Q8Q09_08620 [Deltaproteobacteria bacterium]|nr:hypothetical protein [Deltaproteobacteria bacterium]
MGPGSYPVFAWFNGGSELPVDSFDESDKADPRSLDQSINR